MSLKYIFNINEIKFINILWFIYCVLLRTMLTSSCKDFFSMFYFRNNYTFSFYILIYDTFDLFLSVGQIGINVHFSIWTSSVPTPFIENFSFNNELICKLVKNQTICHKNQHTHTHNHILIFLENLFH